MAVNRALPFHSSMPMLNFMVGQFFKWLMSDPLTDSSKLKCSLNVHEVESIIKAHLVEGHHIFFNVDEIFALIGKRKFYGLCQHNKFELSVFRPWHLLDPYRLTAPRLIGAIYQANTKDSSSYVEFKTELAPGLNILLILFSVFFGMGSVLAIIMSIFMPNVWPQALVAGSYILVLVLILIVIKLVCIKSLPSQHKFHSEILRKLLAETPKLS